MSKTRAEIQFKVLTSLSAAMSAQSRPMRMRRRLTAISTAKWLEINADGTTYISDPDDLDDELFVTFCKLVANAAAEEFGGAVGRAKRAAAAQPHSGDHPADAGLWPAAG
jgi:hypothetical protein